MLWGKLNQLALAAVPPISTEFSKCLLNKIITNDAVHNTFHKHALLLLQAITLMIEDVSLDNMWKQYFVLKHKEAMKKKNCGISLIQ